MQQDRKPAPCPTKEAKCSRGTAESKCRNAESLKCTTLTQPDSENAGIAGTPGNPGEGCSDGTATIDSVHQRQHSRLQTGMPIT